MVKAIHKLKQKTARMIVKHRRICRHKKLTMKQDKIRRKRMSCFLLTLAVLLLIIPGFIMLRHKFSSVITHNEAAEQNQELYSIGSIIYRHLNAYPAYCRKAGYELTHYPKVFLTNYEQELIIFDLIARTKNLTPNIIIEHIQKGFSHVIQKSISREFKQLQKQQNGPSTPSDAEICRYIDENTSTWFETERKSDIDRLREFAQFHQSH